NIFIGNGQPLVVGSHSYTMTPITSPTNTAQLEVGYVNKGVISQIPENSLTGGTLGGLLQFRSQSLVPTQNAIGQMAIGIANTVNAQQQLGQDQSGNVGAALSPMFTVGSPIATANANNTGNLQVTATVTDPNALTTSNYSLQFDGTNYNLMNLSDNKVVNLGPTLPASSDGLTFTAASGAPATGDNFLIQPTAVAAAGFGVAITSTSQIAMAAPIVTNASSANTGSGHISVGVVNGQLTLPNDTVSIVFNKPATTFTATDTTTGIVLGSNVAYTAGDNITYNSTTGITSNPPGTSPVAGDIWTAQISGAPAVGDTFTVGPNKSGSGDSRNGLLIAALQTSKTLNNGTTSIQGAYAQLVSTIGNQTSQLQATSTAANTELTNATSAQQAVSGVNLDQEASNLLQYQQAYQAAAKLMSTVSQLFSTLLSELP
ncbi:MAG: flagellar basal body rod C-terminal domain-containing protein, partial [Burkholderiales bacterium]